MTVFSIGIIIFLLACSAIWNFANDSGDDSIEVYQGDASSKLYDHYDK